MVSGFEIIGLLGVTAGIFGSIESLVLRYGAVVDSKWRLKQYRESLDNYKDRLTLWSMRWGEQPTSVLWSNDGLYRMHSLKESIWHEVKQISDCLYRRHAAGDARSRLSRLRDRYSTSSATRTVHPDGRDPLKAWAEPGSTEHEKEYQRSKLQRLVLGLWEDAQLKQSMDRLSKAMENLESASRIEHHLYWGSNAWTTTPSVEEIEVKALLMQRARRLSSAMRGIHRQYTQNATQTYDPSWRVCGLAFTQLPLESSQLCILELEEQQHLKIRLLVQAEQLDVLHKAYDASIQFELDEADSTDPMADIDMIIAGHEASGTRPDVILKATLIEELRSNLRLSRQTWENIMGGTKAIRAEAALRIAMWSALMWNSPWIVALCACSLRPAYFAGTHEAVVFSNFLGCRLGDRCSCTSPLTKSDQLLSLGLVLVELATGRPVFPHGQRSDLAFRIEDSLRDELIALSNLLDMVEDRTSRLYCRAVRFCLSPGSSNSFHAGLSEGHHARRATDNIVQPLFRHWRVACDRAERLPQPVECLKANAPEAAAYWYPILPTHGH